MKTTALCLAALLAMSCTPVFADTPISEVRPLAATGTVSIDNVKGRIVVRAWDRPEVGITGTLGEGVEKLLVEGSADDLRIEVRYPNSSGGWFGWGGKAGQGGASDLQVSLPVGASVKVDSVSADVEVSGVAGRLLSVDSVSGQVRVRGAKPGEASFETVSGDMDLEVATRDISVDSVSGDVRIRGKVAGVVGVETVSGDVDIHAGLLERLSLSSVSGDSRVKAALAPGGRVSSESVSGELSLILPANTSARLRVETFSGDITSPAGRVKTEEYGPGKSLDTRLGSGSGDIRLESFSGDVDIVLE